MTENTGPASKMPPQPSEQSFDEDLLELAYQHHMQNADLALIHLRDARNTLHGLAQVTKAERPLAKATVLLAAASLESNLVYLSGLALKFAEVRPQKFTKPHLDLLRGFTEEINDNGKIVKKRINKSLIDRMQLVPQLLARAVGRTYQLPVNSAAWRKMQRTLERRDAIVHPRWERYVATLGWWEAAEAVDAIELYLQSIYECLQRYVMGYMHMLWTIKGPTKHDMGIGHRTFGKRGPKRDVSSMDEVGILDVLMREWSDSQFMTLLALTQGTEADSDGSMLTRAALVLAYAMLDAQLAVVSEWKFRENPKAFSATELRFLNELAWDVAYDGEILAESEQHSFKKRVKAIPVVLARCVEHNDSLILDLGSSWAQELLAGHRLRSAVMHSSSDEPIPRISKDELRRSIRAVYAYFRELARLMPNVFGFMTVLLEDTPVPLA